MVILDHSIVYHRAPIFYDNGNYEQRFRWEVDDFEKESQDFLRILEK